MCSRSPRVTGAPVKQQVWDGGIDALRTQAKAPDNTWDLVLVDADELATGCNDGLFEKLDWSAIGGKDHYLPQAVSDCGVGAVDRQHRAGLGQGQVARRADLGGFLGRGEISRQARPAQRRARQPGIRADGRRRGARRRLQGAGHHRRRGPRVPQAGSAQALYRVVVGGSRGGAHPGLRRRADDQCAQRPDRHRRRSTAHRNFGLQFTASLFEMQSWAIVKGSPALRLAQQFLYFTGMPAIEVRLLQQSGDAGLAKGLNDGSAAGTRGDVARQPGQSGAPR